jgi:hypothetical protein
MTYDELTDAEKAALRSFLDAFRPTVAQLSRTLREVQKIKDAYDGKVGAILATVDGPLGAETGLAGADILTSAEVQQLSAKVFGAILDFYGDADRQLYIRVAGLPNV